ncbi:hypothetical protein KJ836_02370 [Patescibacteria group bacterium]|nr:hypothetical protein [Patescibacteria group bacterium]
MPSRRPFIFSLFQNFGPQLASGKLFYVKKPDGIVEQLTPIFFIGIGQKRLITGPYELTSDIIEASVVDMKQMSRMKETNLEYGIYQELRITCAFHVTFRPLVEIEKGVLWDEKFCRKFGLDFKSWRNLIKVSLNLDQIDQLVAELKEINPA